MAVCLPSSGPGSPLVTRCIEEAHFSVPGPVRGAVGGLGHVPSKGSVCSAEPRGSWEGAAATGLTMWLLSAGGCGARDDLCGGTVPKACWSIAGTLNKATGVRLRSSGKWLLLCRCRRRSREPPPCSLFCDADEPRSPSLSPSHPHCPPAHPHCPSARPAEPRGALRPAGAWGGGLSMQPGSDRTRAQRWRQGGQAREGGGPAAGRGPSELATLRPSSPGQGQCPGRRPLGEACRCRGPRRGGPSHAEGDPAPGPWACGPGQRHLAPFSSLPPGWTVTGSCSELWCPRRS